MSNFPTHCVGLWLLRLVYIKKKIFGFLLISSSSYDTSTLKTIIINSLFFCPTLVSSLRLLQCQKLFQLRKTQGHHQQWLINTTNASVAAIATVINCERKSIECIFLQLSNCLCVIKAPQHVEQLPLCYQLDNHFGFDQAQRRDTHKTLQIWNPKQLRKRKILINKVGFIWFGWKNREKKSKESKLLYIYKLKCSICCC